MKATFEFKCPLNMAILNHFFKQKNILLNYTSIIKNVNLYKSQVVALFLKDVNPHLVNSIEILFDTSDLIIFRTLLLTYVQSGNQYVVITKVPHMATPLVTSLNMASDTYALISHPEA